MLSLSSLTLAYLCSSQKLSRFCDFAISIAVGCFSHELYVLHNFLDVLLFPVIVTSPYQFSGAALSFIRPEVLVSCFTLLTELSEARPLKWVFHAVAQRQFFSNSSVRERDYLQRPFLFVILSTSRRCSCSRYLPTFSFNLRVSTLFSSLVKYPGWLLYRIVQN